MSKRTAKFVPALFATVLAAANLTTGTDLRAQAAQAGDDTCLSSPKGATSNGGHWYYRIDRATKRQCWYLRDEGEKTTRAPLDSPATPPAATADAAPQQPGTITNKAVADARAEWVAQQNRAERNSTARPDSQTTGAVSAPAIQNNKPAPNVLAPAPISTARWSDTTGTGSTTPADVQTAAADASAADQAQDSTEQAQQPAAAPPVAAVAADPAPAKPTASLQMLLLVMAAALALAGITVSLIFRVGRLRARRAMRRKRRAMWDSAQKKTKRRAPQPSLQPQPMFHDEDARPRRTAAVQHTRVPKERPRAPQDQPYAPQAVRARAPQERVRAPQERARGPQEREQQVSEMLARLARSAHS